jgi:hypothetical protein
LNQGLALSAECGDAESHGDAMISARVDHRAVERLSTGDVEAILELFNFCAHRAEISGDKGYAIRFLNAEFFCIADANAAAGIGTHSCEDGEFIDELGGQGAADGCGAKTLFIGGDLNGPDEFRVDLLNLKDSDMRAQRCEYIEKRGAGGIETDAVEDEAGAGEERRSAQKERRGGDVTRNGRADGLKRLGS